MENIIEKVIPLGGQHSKNFDNNIEAIRFDLYKRVLFHLGPIISPVHAAAYRYLFEWFHNCKLTKNP